MTIILQALSPLQDAQAIASCNATAFYSDKHWRHQYGAVPLTTIISDVALRTPWTLSSQRHSLRCLKAVDTSTGELVAYARWILPSELDGNEEIWPEACIAEPTKEDYEKFKTDYFTTNDYSTGGSRYVNVDMTRSLGHAPGAKDSEIRKKYSDREFLELDYIAVRDGWQRKGIAKMLVRIGLEKAKEFGCHLIIMGFTDKGRLLYRSMPELRYEGVVTQSCQRWPEGRQDGCECVAAFWIALWDDIESQATMK